MSEQLDIAANSGPLMDHEQRMLRGIRELQTVATAQRDRREHIATAALQGLLASSPAATQRHTQPDLYATRAVRYADALLEALNQSTYEALDHAARR